MRAILNRSSDLVNAYCAAPNLPQRHDFRGGTITREQHQWKLGTDYYVGNRRVYPWHTPFRDVNALAIRITNNYSVSLTPTDLFVNGSESYIEVTSLAAVSFGIYPLGVAPNLGLYIPVAEVSYDYGWIFQETDEDLESYDAASYMSGHMSWMTTPVPVIKKNGTVLDPSSYTVDYVEGAIILSSEPGANDSFTATYSYSLPGEVQQATGIIASAQLGERSMAQKGMTGLGMIKVDEFQILRMGGRSGLNPTALSNIEIPGVAQALLSPHRFFSVGSAS